MATIFRQSPIQMTPFASNFSNAIVTRVSGVHQCLFKGGRRRIEPDTRSPSRWHVRSVLESLSPGTDSTNTWSVNTRTRRDTGAKCAGRDTRVSRTTTTTVQPTLVSSETCVQPARNNSLLNRGWRPTFYDFTRTRLRRFYSHRRRFYSICSQTCQWKLWKPETIIVVVVDPIWLSLYHTEVIGTPSSHRLYILIETFRALLKLYYLLLTFSPIRLYTL